MSQARLSPAADVDLLSIYIYIAEQSGDEQAQRVTRIIKDKCAKTATASGTGKPRQELGPNIRSFSIWSFVVFYREVDDGILVVRILHGARDITPDDIQSATPASEP